MNYLSACYSIYAWFVIKKLYFLVHIGLFPYQRTTDGIIEYGSAFITRPINKTNIFFAAHHNPHHSRSLFDLKTNQNMFLLKIINSSLRNKHALINLTKVMILDSFLPVLLCSTFKKITCKIRWDYKKGISTARSQSCRLNVEVEALSTYNIIHMLMIIKYLILLWCAKICFMFYDYEIMNEIGVFPFVFMNEF